MINYKFHHVHIVCENLDKMISFFTDTLNARLIEMKEFKGVKGAKIDINGTQMNLRVPFKDESIYRHRNNLGYHHLAFQVENCDMAYYQLKSEGYEFINPPTTYGNNKTAFFIGPEGIMIELIQIQSNP